MSILLKNKKARYEFSIDSKIEAGIVLYGHEVKSLRQKHGSLAGSYVRVIGDELFLLNAQINPYSYADTRDYDPKRTRKLLVHKKQIFKLREITQQKGWTLVPMSIKLVGKNIKVVVGVGKGKKQFEKRAELKKRAQKRDVERQLKQKIRMR